MPSPENKLWGNSGRGISTSYHSIFKLKISINSSFQQLEFDLLTFELVQRKKSTVSLKNYSLPGMQVFLNTLVATSWNAFASDIVVKSRDAIKLHQEKYNANSVIPNDILASDYLTDCHQALFFQQDTLVH